MEPFFLAKPQSLADIQGQDAAISAIESFFNTFKKGKSLFLYGPPGTGKTSAVYAYAKEQDYDVLELNASDSRSKKVIEEFLSKATGQMSLFGTKKIILIDEVDGLSGRKDRGAASAIAAAVKTSSFPIVITGSDVFDKKFSPIKKVSELVEFNELSVDAIVEVLRVPIKQHNLSVDEKDVRAIARNSAGDARAALSDLFTFVLVKDSETSDLSSRKKTVAITQALIPVFKSTNPDVVFGSFDDVDEDLDKIFLWVDQNIPVEYTKAKDLHNAYEMLSLADRFFGRIRRWQYYRFYVYCYLLLSVGVALAKEEKYTRPPRYQQPSRLLAYWRANMQFAKRKSIVQKLAAATNVSQKTTLQDSLPYLAPFLARNKQAQEDLDLAADEIAWLKKIST